MPDRILVVDDSLTVRMDLDEALGLAGYRTELVASLGEARVALDVAVPALVILDVMLPDGNGVDLMIALRQDPRTARVPVMLFSSEAEVADRIRGLSGGADEYLAKPYDAGNVVARATALLRARSPSGAPSVLVIDDSVTYRQAAAAMLREAGYTVLLAANGEEGLLRAAAAHPDAMLVDGILPDLDGPEVIRRIRLDPGLASTPCVLLTASEGASTEVEALDAGADAYVSKSASTEVVLTRLGAVIRAAAATGNARRSGSLLAPKRILAVDDSPTYLEALTDHLRASGLEAVKARSGEEALALLAVEPVDCILLDLVMPGLSGTETCRRIKAEERIRHVPLVILTSMEDQEAMIDAINAGADDFVAKSAELDVLMARVRAQLRRRQFEEDHRKVHAQLMLKQAEADSARRVADALAIHSAELERLNQELQTFSYTVSHDLRQPLRSIDGFSKVLLERYDGHLDDQGRHWLGRIRAGAQRMSALIDGLLVLSRVSRRPLDLRPVSVSELATRIVARLQDSEPERPVQIDIAPTADVLADPALLESLLENLLGNAWKFSSKRPTTQIEVGSSLRTGEVVHFVRDHGDGFDMTYADRLFGPFQRLHRTDEFEGTGIGLATALRIVGRHGGRIWAEGQQGVGATFFFTLPPSGGAS